MKKEIQKVIADTKQWVEQEKTWGGQFFMDAAAAEKLTTAKGGVTVTVGSPIRQQKEPVVTATTPRPSGHPAVSVSRSSPSATQKAVALKALYDTYNTCTRCPLGESRLNFVFGVGDPNARVMLVGEGPGYDEDHQGEPFIGRSGKLLDKMMEAIGLSRQKVYIANIVKCHPMINPQTPHERGNDRPPTPLESSTCSPILQQQIAIIRPTVILTLGSPSTKALLGIQDGISKVRGKLFLIPKTFFLAKPEGVTDLFGKKKDDVFEGFTPEQLDLLLGIQILPTYHPAALLRNPNLKKDAWEDLKLLRDTIQKTPR